MAYLSVSSQVVARLTVSLCKNDIENYRAIDMLNVLFRELGNKTFIMFG